MAVMATVRRIQEVIEDGLGFETAIEVVKSASPVDAILKDQYEARLKADMVATLEELKLEVEGEKRITEHLHYDDLERAESYNIGIDNCIDVIQDRINKLRRE